MTTAKIYTEILNQQIDVKNLRIFAAKLGIQKISKLNRAELVEKIAAEVFAVQTNSDLRTKNLTDILLRYAQAAINLYGIIPASELLDIYNQQNKESATPKDILCAVLGRNSDEYGFTFWKDYIVDSDFSFNNYRDAQDLLILIENKPRYIPDREEFLRYADWQYFEQTEGIARLVYFLTSVCHFSSIVASQIALSVHVSCVLEESYQQQIKCIEEFGIKLNQIQWTIAVQILLEIQQTTRLWSTKGYTKKELF